MAHKIKNKRLYFVTGKGGVGKTVVSWAQVQYLQNLGAKVLYLDFVQALSYDYTQSLRPQEIDQSHRHQQELLEQLGISSLPLKLYQSATEYVAKKLKSELVASWIVKTPFFKSLFSLLPSLGHLILLGHLLDMLEKDPELTIVVDSPASGHALTTFESTHNFKKIFGQGLMVKDINKMHDRMKSPDWIKVIVVARPTPMAIHEGIELVEKLTSQGVEEPALILNDCYMKIPSIGQWELPSFLKQQVEMEESLLKIHGQQIVKCLKHSMELTSGQVAQDLVGQSDDLEALL